MICQSCQTPLPDDARFCCSCGGSVTAYEAPDGFEIDPESLRFYRDDGMSADGTERYITWFDPDAGTYEQGSRPMEPAREAEPEPAEPKFSFAPVEEPKAEIPEGFTLDPASGLYYLATAGRDRSTGQTGEWYTWYYPDSGEYRQEFYPSDPEPETRQNEDSEPRRGVAERPRRDASSGRKANPFLIVLPLIALLGGSAFAFIQAGGLDMFVAPKLPEGIVTVSRAEEDLPVFTPAGEEPPERDREGDDSTGEAADAPSEEDADGSWAALYADYLEELNLEPREYDKVTQLGAGVIPTFTLDGETVAVFEVSFIKSPKLDDPIMVFTTLYPREDETKRLKLNTSGIVFHIQDGKVSRESMGSLRYDEWLGHYPLVVYETGEAGRQAVLDILDDIQAGLADPESMPKPVEWTNPSAEASADNWAALYADYLGEQVFDYQEFRFYGDMATFPVYTSGGTSLAVMLVCFYDVEGFDNPVMDFLSMMEMEGEPGTLDTSPYSFLHVIRDGAVSREPTPQEIDLIVRHDDNTGMNSIRGSLITTYELHATATGAEGSAVVDDNFAYLYDWLDYEAQRAEPARAEPREGAAEASAENWAALYADFLEELNLKPQELGAFDGGTSTLPVYYDDDGTLLAVVTVSFYATEGITEPVMAITDLVELQGSPGMLDSTPAELAYVIRDGEVTPAYGSGEEDLVYGVFEESGMRYIKGEPIIHHGLGGLDDGMVTDKLSGVFDWLDEQAR